MYKYIYIFFFYIYLTDLTYASIDLDHKRFLTITYQKVNTLNEPLP